MIVANKTYKLEYGGTIHSIKRDELVRMTDRLAASYKRASESRKRILWGIILKLNWVYISSMPYRFASEMDKQDFVSRVVMYMPQALQYYEESKGSFCTYLASWKHAGFSRWQDEKDVVRLPSNVRIEMQSINRKIRLGIALTEREASIFAKPAIQVTSLNAPVNVGEFQMQDTVVGEDPREAIGEVSYDAIWKQIKIHLPPDDFQIFLWYHHDNYKLGLQDIGSRIGVSRERVRQRLRDMRGRLARKLKIAGIMGKGAV